MRPEITRSRTWTVAAVGGAAALLTAACGSSSPTSTANTASAPGITATSVTIGSTQPLTGPAAPGYSEIAPAANAYFKYVNAHGGVNGRTINYTFLDDQYNPTSTSTQTHKLILQDNVFAIFQALGTPTHLAVVNYINQSRGARPVRRLGLQLLERRVPVSRHLRMAAELHHRRQDSRPVHRAELQRQEDRLLPAGAER